VRWIFVNLPVADLAAAKAFYSGLGFGFNEQFSDERTASVVVADNIVVMLLTRDRFADFVPDADRIGDPSRSTTVLNALSADSREEADDLLAGRWPPAASRGCPRRTTGSCTASASPTPTATSGRSSGWTPPRPVTPR
jgi:predicted lactoylglutathione lyase